jgi:predicted amidohydrolase
MQHKLYIQPGTIMVEQQDGQYVNRAYFFGPHGNVGYQDKLQLTEFEKSTNMILHGHGQTVFDTVFGKIGIAVCYDSEFPELVRRLVLQGVSLILVPSYTTSLAGLHRVLLSSRARALENQCYVATAFTVGTVAISEPMDRTVGQAVIAGPIETGFSDDGVLAQGKMNEEMMITAKLSFEKIPKIRTAGEVHNYEDFKQRNDVVPLELTVVSL